MERWEARSRNSRVHALVVWDSGRPAWTWTADERVGPWPASLESVVADDGTSSWRLDLRPGLAVVARVLSAELGFAVTFGSQGTPVGAAYARALERVLHASWHISRDARAESGFREAEAWIAGGVEDLLRVRRALRSALGRYGDHPVAYAACVELLANSLRYGSPRVRIAAGEAGGRPAVEIRDRQSFLDLARILFHYLHPAPPRDDARLHRGYWVVLSAADGIWSQPGPPAVTVVTFPPLTG